MATKSGPGERLPFVEASRARGKTYLYYRRAGQRLPLPGLEGSAEFLAEYHRLKAEFEKATVRFGQHTVGAAITHYLGTADYLSLSDSSQAAYRRTLELFRLQAGHLEMTAVDGPWVDGLRDLHAQESRRHQWVALRSRMTSVEDAYRRAHPKLKLDRPWADSRSLRVEESDQNRPWPDSVLIQVFREATPEFRAFLTVALLTTQRNGDVCEIAPDAYDPALKTLKVRQIKTGANLVLHVPSYLAAALDGMAGRLPGQLLVTPRGQAWTTKNSRETMSGLCARLGTGRYVIHGLRATGAVALKMLGFADEAIMALTGHKTPTQLRVYLRGVDKLELGTGAAQALDGRYSDVIDLAMDGANMNSFSGVTGRGAAKRGIVGSSRKSKTALARTAKQLPNAKQSPGEW